MTGPIPLVCIVLLLAMSISDLVQAANWDFNYDMTGFTRRSRLLVTNCLTTSIKEQINLAFGGRKTMIPLRSSYFEGRMEFNFIQK